MNFKDIYKKYNDTVPYIIFGVLTTAVNVIVFWICTNIFHTGVDISTITAWIFAVFFAYVTNRKWVFYSAENSKRGILKEIISFFACRLATGLYDLAFMHIFVEMLHFNDLWMKILSNVVVVIVNYLASRLLIFKKKK